MHEEGDNYSSVAASCEWCPQLAQSRKSKPIAAMSDLIKLPSVDQETLRLAGWTVDPLVFGPAVN